MPRRLVEESACRGTTAGTRTSSRPSSCGPARSCRSTRRSGPETRSAATASTRTCWRSTSRRTCSRDRSTSKARSRATCSSSSCSTWSRRISGSRRSSRGSGCWRTSFPGRTSSPGSSTAGTLGAPSCRASPFPADRSRGRSAWRRRGDLLERVRAREEELAQRSGLDLAAFSAACDPGRSGRRARHAAAARDRRQRRHPPPLRGIAAPASRPRPGRAAVARRHALRAGRGRGLRKRDRGRRDGDAAPGRRVVAGLDAEVPRFRDGRGAAAALLRDDRDPRGRRRAERAARSDARLCDAPSSS